MRSNHRALLQNARTSHSDLAAPRFFGRAKPAFLIVGLAVLGVAAPAQAEESIGGAKSVVNLVMGDLATGDKVNLFQGDEVFRDEGVRTDADSSARLVLRDNTNLLVGPSSSVKLDRFVYAGPSQPGAIAVNLVKGALRFATGDADKKAYLISTPTAALGVRGTVLKIVSSASKTYVLLDEGGAIACTRIAAHRRCLQLTEANQVVVVTATQVRWAPEAAGSVSAAIAAIADSTSASSSDGVGGQVSVTPSVVAPPANPSHKHGNCDGGDDEGDGEVAAVSSGPDGIGNQGHHGHHGHHGHGH
jgi:hypothetical protein